MARLSFINGGWDGLPRAEQARLAATHRLTRRQRWRGLVDIGILGDHILELGQLAGRPGAGRKVGRVGSDRRVGHRDRA